MTGTVESIGKMLLHNALDTLKARGYVSSAAAAEKLFRITMEEQALWPFISDNSTARLLMQISSTGRREYLASIVYGNMGLLGYSDDDALPESDSDFVNLCIYIFAIALSDIIIYINNSKRKSDNPLHDLAATIQVLVDDIDYNLIWTGLADREWIEDYEVQRGR